MLLDAMKSQVGLSRSLEAARCTGMLDPLVHRVYVYPQVLLGYIGHLALFTGVANVIMLRLDVHLQVLLTAGYVITLVAGEFNAEMNCLHVLLQLVLATKVFGTVLTDQALVLADNVVLQVFLRVGRVLTPLPVTCVSSTLVNLINKNKTNNIIVYKSNVKQGREGQIRG